MLDKKKVGRIIALYRKRCNMTQKQMADILHVTYQSVSRWELGLSLPSVDMIYDIASILGVTVDVLLGGNIEDDRDIAYQDTGLNTVKLHSIKEKLTQLITEDERILHAKYIDPVFFRLDLTGMKEPTFLFATNVPGSKARLARERGWNREICMDLVARAVNNVIRYGAKPVICQAHLVCGEPGKELLLDMGEALKEVCESNHVLFAGMEVSAQPVNYRDGEYEISLGIMGIVDREKVITGERIQEEDVIIGVRTEGIDSVSFPFVKVMLDREPGLAYAKVEDEHYFLDEILKPNIAYEKLMEELKESVDIHGVFRPAPSLLNDKNYISIPHGLGACIDLSSIWVDPLYEFIANLDMVGRKTMPYRFHFGIGLELVVPRSQYKQAVRVIEKYQECYCLGSIKRNSGHFDKKVWTEGRIQW